MTYIADPATHYADDGVPGKYWACEQPERPANEFTRWAWECDSCWIHMVASHRMGVGPTIDYATADEGEPHDFERARQHRLAKGLRA